MCININVAKKAIIYCILLSLISQGGCKYECPPCDAEMARWTPYNVGDKVTWLSNHGDTLSTSIYEKFVSDSYEEKYKWRDECEAKCYFIGHSENQGYFKFDIIKIHSETYFFIHIYNDVLSCRNCEHQISPITIGGRYYNEALVVENDTLARPDDWVWKAIVAKDYGIVAFYDRRGQTEWILSQ